MPILSNFKICRFFGVLAFLICDRFPNKSVSPFSLNKASQSALWGRNLHLILNENDNSKVKYAIIDLKATKNAKHNQVVETIIGEGIDPLNPLKLLLAYLPYYCRVLMIRE